MIRNGAFAINPVDWAKQTLGGLMYGHIEYPFVLGNDVAGEVFEVGLDVTRFKVGERVVGHAVGMDKRSNKSSEGAFQLYTVLRTNLVSPIPIGLSYEEACVLPLGVSTAACGLFQADYLALNYPTPKPDTRTGETLLVWGASTSVGSNAVQLAIAAGYDVIATASPRNHDFVKNLGASEVFDYKSENVVQDIIKSFKGRNCAGAIAIGENSSVSCMKIVSASKGKKFIASASAVNLPTKPPSSLGMLGFVFSFLSFSVSLWLKSKLKGVDVKFIFGTDLMANGVSKVIYEDFLPIALTQGKYVCAPRPLVVGKGLGHVQEAFQIHQKGVSAKKVVVSL